MIPLFDKNSVVRALGAAGLLAAVAAAHAADPWAAEVIRYDPGSSPAAGYTAPTMSLGPPTRVTGGFFGFPSNVTMFNPPFGPDEIVSIGEGGHLTVRFDRSISDDPGHLHGVDLIVFGKLAFIDADYPNGRQFSPPLTFGSSPLAVEVSADGQTFVPVARPANALFPTQAWLDAPADGSGTAGVPADFLKPMNPALTLADFSGLSYAQSLARYDGSGGGTPIDLAGTGLAEAWYVRLTLADDGNPDTQLHGEIDALAAVPEPTTAALIGLATLLGRRVRRRGH